MNFPDLLKEYHIPVKEPGTHHHVTSGYLGFDCPFCSKGQGRFRMGYHLSKGFTTCWTCGSHSLLDTLVELLEEQPSKIKQLLETLDKQLQEVKTRHPGKLTLPIGVGPLQTPHFSFLQRRGIDPDVASRVWGVQGLGIAPRLSWRLFIPIHQNSIQVSWTTRSLGEEEPRYITAKDKESKLSPKSILFGEDFARHSIVIVEGPLDAIRIGPGSVAILGLQYTRTQVECMSKYPIRVVCLDAESTAQRVARKLCTQLEVFPGSTYLVELSTGKDPGDCSDKEIKELRRRFLE